MANPTIASIAGKVACGGAIAANTGKLGCLSLFGTPEHLLALRKGTKILSTESFDLAYLTPSIQKGTIIPLMGASAFEDVSGEDTYSTNASGEKRLNLKGLVEYKLMFEEGHEFYRELSKLEGYKQFDFIIGDENGNWLMVVNSDGSYGGFEAGHTTPELTKRKVAGGDAESKSFLVQFLNRDEFDTDYTILHRAELDFSPNDVPAVNGAELNWDTVPVATDTDLIVQVSLTGDRSTLVEGALVANFLLTVNASEVTPSGVVESASGGVYTISFTPALAGSDDVSIDLVGSGGIDVTNVDDVLYRSDALEITV